MRLGFKFALFLVVPLVIVTVAGGFWYLQQSRTMLREELAREGRAIAQVVQIAAEDYLRDRQLSDLQELVSDITGYERVLGIRVFDRDGIVIHQSASLDPYPFQHRDVLEGALRDGKPGQMQRLIGEQPVVGFIVPLNDQSGARVGAIQVLQLESFMEEDDRANRHFIYTLSFALVIATILIVWIVTRLSVTRPIEALVRSFREVGARERPSPVPIHSQDEFGRLAVEFNRMCERLEGARESLVAEQEQRRQVEAALRNTERLAGLGRLAAGLAHEIGTPLNVIGGRAESLLRKMEGNELAERNLRIISSQIDRIARTVRDMLDFARMKPARRVPTHIGDAVNAVLDLLDVQLERRGITVEVDIAPDLPVISADPDQLQQVFLNVVLNAMDAMASGGVLKIRAKAAKAVRPERDGPAEPCVVATFEDTGTGIRTEVLGQVFDPFFTTKDVGKGTGLGLSVSYGIVRDHGGWFDLESESGRGTRVGVYLPIAPTDPAPQLAIERGQEALEPTMKVGTD